MGWIANSKKYDEGTERWYCQMCGHRQPLEVNPEWEAAGRPHKWEGECPWEWFVRCAGCKYAPWDSSYDCPHCGRPIEEEQLPIKVTNYYTNIIASLEYGVTGHEWEEKHRCKTCGRIYWIHNGDW